MHTNILRLNSMVIALANSSLTILAARMGSDIIAANAVLTGIFIIMWSMSYGFGCANQVFVATYMGSGRPKAAKNIFRMGMGCGFVAVIVIVTTVAMIPHKIFAIYSNDPAVITKCMDVSYFFIPAIAMALIENMMQCTLTGMGLPKMSFYVSFSATWFLQVPLAYVLGLHFDLKLKALWMAMMAMEMYKLTAYTLILSVTDWKEQSRIAVSLMKEKKSTQLEESATLLSMYGDDEGPPSEAGELPDKDSIRRRSSLLLLNSRESSLTLASTGGTNQL